jgi:Fur family ferric uptake transcriptional regulator
MNERVLALRNALTERGFRLTAARKVILDVFVRSGGHITADDLAEMIRRKSPGIGRMTVYRTLELLGQLGLIRPIYQGTGAAHYVLMEEGHHHHLVCSSCGIVIEVQECALEQIEQAVSGRFRFQVQGHLLEFYGTCYNCQD